MSGYTTALAAPLLGIGDRAVRLRCERGVLAASKDSEGRWQISADALESELGIDPRIAAILLRLGDEDFAVLRDLVPSASAEIESTSISPDSGIVGRIAAIEARLDVLEGR